MIKLPCYSYHFILLPLSMSSAIESDRQGRRTQLSVVGGQTVIADAADGDCVNTCRISIAVTVIVCQATISCRPHVDITFTLATLDTKILSRETNGLV